MVASELAPNPGVSRIVCFDSRARPGNRYSPSLHCSVNQLAATTAEIGTAVTDGNACKRQDRLWLLDSSCEKTEGCRANAQDAYGRADGMWKEL